MGGLGLIRRSRPGVVTAVSLGVDGFVTEAVFEADFSIAITLNGAEGKFDGLSTGCCSEAVVAMVCVGLGGLGNKCEEREEEEEEEIFS